MSFMRNIDDFQIGDDFMSGNDIERHEQIQKMRGRQSGASFVFTSQSVGYINTKRRFSSENPRENV